jgi:ribosomal protein L37E
MSYTQCPRCGQKALSVATQCPHCGVPFEIRRTYQVSRPRSPRVLVVLVVAALGVIFIGLDMVRRGPGVAGRLPGPRMAIAADSTPQPSSEAPSSAPSESLPPTAGPQERRYTNIWVNVRQARRPTAAVVRVLRPGEPVLVDSLRQNWYRVVADGQAVGYVYRGFVDPAPPLAPH